MIAFNYKRDTYASDESRSRYREAESDAILPAQRSLLEITI